MKAMETVKDLIEEAKLRIVWWALCIFAVSYFLSHTSKSMWMNLPMSILFVCAMRILLNEVEFRRKVRPVRPQTYLSHLEKKQLSVNDSRLSTAPTPQKWKRKIDSPIVEAAIDDFVDKILKDFVVDLWYGDITPDREFPKQIQSIIMDALGEVSGRIKEINLVDLLTRDIIDLVGDHLDLFRRNQAVIGADVMGTLSSEERDERLKHHLMASKELHPALMSPESEYKVLQRLVGGVLTVVLRPREAQCPVIRSISRELLTCLVMQPVMNLASPGYINELIEYVLLTIQDDSTKDCGNQSTAVALHDHDSAPRKNFPLYQGVADTTLATVQTESFSDSDQRTSLEEPLLSRPADWARGLEAATQRRTEVLAPENLENMWTKGRNYKKKENKSIIAGVREPVAKGSGLNSASPTKNLGKEMVADRPVVSTVKEEGALLRLTWGTNSDSKLRDGKRKETQCTEESNKESVIKGGYLVDESGVKFNVPNNGNKILLKRSNSTSALKLEPDAKRAIAEAGGPIISEFYSADFGRRREQYSGKSVSDMVVARVGQHLPKLKCRVMGAYFEKLGSKSFAVYSIAVTDAENRTWFVKRRYRNFERLHRHLKEIPNYTLHLPPKRIFSSSTEDAFVHQRCIQLDKYLQELLSIANVAEQHEVWDFLSVSSKNYSFGKSSSVMRTLAVNVDDAVDDIVRQFKGVSDGLVRKVVGPTSSPDESLSSVGDATRNLSWSTEEISKHMSRQDTGETANSFSDNEEGDHDGSRDSEEVQSGAHANGWHSDTELRSKGYPPRVIKKPIKLGSEERHENLARSEMGQGGFPAIKFPVSDRLEDPIGMPAEWTPPNVSVPLLNLVDKIFQLKRRGWLRRQVFWISKQILHLIMDDAIDDWLLRQIHWLRRDVIIAQGIRWVQDVLWPDGTFFIRLRNAESKDDDPQFDPKSFQGAKQIGGSKVCNPGSFEQQLEAARRASDVRKMLLDGAPTTLVSLIGHKQYKRCARDIYYFTQSTICIKQLGYAILELLLISIFPELRNLVLDVHEKTHIHQPV